MTAILEMTCVVDIMVSFPESSPSIKYLRRYVLLIIWFSLQGKEVHP